MSVTVKKLNGNMFFVVLFGRKNKWKIGNKIDQTLFIFRFSVSLSFDLCMLGYQCPHNVFGNIKCEMKYHCATDDI